MYNCSRCSLLSLRQSTDQILKPDSAAQQDKRSGLVCRSEGNGDVGEERGNSQRDLNDRHAAKTVERYSSRWRERQTETSQPKGGDRQAGDLTEPAMVELHCRRVLEKIGPLRIQGEIIRWKPSVGHLGPGVVHETRIKPRNKGPWKYR